MLPITRAHLTHPISRPALRDPERFMIPEVRAIVMHWTANTGRGANAMANRNYFNLGSRHASAHYCVDDRTIVQCLPHNEVGYHVGARRYLTAGQMIMAGGRLGPNHYTIGIEMCVNSDGDWNATYQHSAELAAWLLGKYPGARLLRHFDITGKDCPKMMLEPAPWAAFVEDVKVAATEHERALIAIAESRVNGLNVRNAPGMDGIVLGTLHQGEPVTITQRIGNWCEVEPGGWCHSNFLTNYKTHPAHVLREISTRHPE